MRLVIDSNAQDIYESLEAGSRGLLMKFVDREIKRGALELAREARARAPKAFSTLTQSITMRHRGVADYEVTAGTDYAVAVEKGTGPGARPKPMRLYYWIRVHGIKPRDERMDERDLAFAISRSIFRKGTRSRPFMGPAFDAKRDRLRELMQRGVASGLQEMGK